MSTETTLQRQLQDLYVRSLAEHEQRIDCYFKQFVMYARNKCVDAASDPVRPLAEVTIDLEGSGIDLRYFQSPQPNNLYEWSPLAVRINAWCTQEGFSGAEVRWNNKHVNGCKGFDCIKSNCKIAYYMLNWQAL